MNKSQKIAVLHTEGPMLVLAGPGSGKTTVITQRTKHLIEEHGINPARILVITFTKAAAEEMKERFDQLMGEDTKVNFGTFHAVFFKILKYAYHYNASNIIREEDRNRYFKEIIAKLNLEIEDEKEFIEGISSEISLVKGERMMVENYYSINCSEENFQKIYYAYEQQLRNANLIDFDDMLLLCYELLIAREDILKFWQQKYTYILIDEFQDINRVQYDIIRLLAKPENNLFIVGDDDQSIYRFRGAKPEIMLNFETDYKNAKRILLDQNYRSAKHIVKGASRVISNNKKRFPKEITAVKEDGEEIEIKTLKDLKMQNQVVLDKIQAYLKQGIPYHQIAILFRTNTQPRALVEKLMEYNIPFKMKDIIPNIYEHWISQNILAYIKLALGSRDRNLFLHIINRPKRYISREYLKEPEVELENLKKSYAGKDYVIERIEKLEYDFTMLKTLNPYAAIHYIRKAIGYDEYLVEYAKFRRMKEEELFDVLNELQDSAKEYSTYDEWFLHIEEYKEELKQQIQLRQKKDFDAIAMVTFHASKGLEYQKVFIIDANEGITPHRKAILPEDMEEERRMFYVAMTRAKEKLHIYSVKERYGKEFSCSRFVGELLLDISKLKKGVRVVHKKYGLGTIERVQNEKVIVKFDEILLPKILNTEYCQMNQILTIKEKE